MNAMQSQLNDATVRMQRAEEERNMVLKLVTKKSDELIDSKGVGQPFKFREVRPGRPRVEPQIQDLPEGQVRR